MTIEIRTEIRCPNCYSKTMSHIWSRHNDDETTDFKFHCGDCGRFFEFDNEEQKKLLLEDKT